MLSPELNVAVRIAAELFYHSYRVREYLQRIPPGASNEHRRLIEALLRVLERSEHDATTGFAALRDIPPVDESRQQAIEHLEIALRRLSNCFITIHELLAYLPRESINPEVVFALESCFPDFFAQAKPSVVLGCIVNAFEFDFVEILKEKLPEISEIDIFSEGEQIRVLQLAICDVDSSLAYAILAHEVGHAIDSQHRISSEVVREFVTDFSAQGDVDEDFLKILQSWCGELCADLIALLFVGPAPMLSLLSMEYCIHPGYEIYMHNDTHPSTRTRLQVMEQSLTGAARALVRSETDFYDDAWHLNIRQQVSDPKQQKDAEDLHRKITENLIMPMADRVRVKLSRLALPDLSFVEGSLKRCVNRLRLGSPVSAQGERPESLAKKVRAHKKKYKCNPFNSEEKQCEWEKWEEERRGAFKTLCKEFTEKPLDVPTILLAGYRRRTKIIDDLYQEKKQPLASSRAVEDLCKSLSGLDRLIGSSIVTARVHRDVCARLKSPKKGKMRG
jgi:hypothetical protein